ncbi:hypothetical protein [Streptomyces sp. NPDC056160]|uniref:hypothetical protein n=1 Tax=Streptomyces sp. NPDC056160 TaxID=3345731 RepID=UPI0035DAC81F
MRKIAHASLVALSVGVLAVTQTGAAQAAAPHWNKTVKCHQKDWDGRNVPTRTGNSELGWAHFSGRHNIRTCRIVNAPLNGKPDKTDGRGGLEYWGYAFDGRHAQVKIIVKAQVTRRTQDKRYDAGKGQMIGVITAFCKGMTKCPDWMNQSAARFTR